MNKLVVPMPPDLMERLNREALFLLQKKLVKYTNGESSTVGEETATRLWEGIVFTLFVAVKRLRDCGKWAENITGEKLYPMGQKYLTRDFLTGKMLLYRVIEHRISTKNLSYISTLSELPAFFKNYNLENFPQETPCMIDYPLCVQIDGEGAPFMRRYLEALYFENQFCEFFLPEDLEKAMQIAVPEYDEQRVNLCRNIFTAALFRVLLGKDPLALVCTQEECDFLTKRLKGISLQELLEKALERLKKMLDAGEGLRNYLRSVVPGLAAELEALLKQGFPLLYEKAPGTTNINKL